MLDLRTSFACHGNLCYPDGTTFAAAVRIELVLEPKIRCIVEFELVDGDPWLVLVQDANIRPPDHPEFHGFTDNGQPVSATGLSLCSKDSLQFRASEVNVGAITACSKMRFFLPNLHMTPRRTVMEGPGARPVPESFRVPLPGPLGTGEAEVYVRPDIEDVAASAAENKNSVVTAAVTLNKADSVLEWADVEEPVYRLCLLLSLASGRHINWAIAQGEDWWIYRSHVMSGWTGRGATVWIKSFPEAVRALLACWPTICDFSSGQTLAFTRALNLFLHSGPTFSFPVPFYCTAGALEILSTAFLNDCKSGYLPDREAFTTVRKSFKEWATKNFIPAITDNNLLTEFHEAKNAKFDAVNGRFLRSRISGLAQQLNLACSHDQVKRFVKIRNETTHGTDLTAQDEWELFTALAPIDDLLVRVLLRLVGFSGEYWGGSDGFGTLRPLV